jgi:hypothetical protein
VWPVQPAGKFNFAVLARCAGSGEFKSRNTDAASVTACENQAAATNFITGGVYAGSGSAMIKRKCHTYSHQVGYESNFTIGNVGSIAKPGHREIAARPGCEFNLSAWRNIHTLGDGEVCKPAAPSVASSIQPTPSFSGNLTLEMIAGGNPAALATFHAGKRHRLIAAEQVLLTMNARPLLRNGRTF